MTTAPAMSSTPTVSLAGLDLETATVLDLQKAMNAHRLTSTVGSPGTELEFAL